MINDVLAAGLDEIIEALPFYPISGEDAAEIAHYEGGRPEDYLGTKTGPKIFFDGAYRRLLEEKQEEKPQELVAS